jgi:replicative DNA helicase
MVDLAYSGATADEAEAAALAHMARIEVASKDRSVADALMARLDVQTATPRVKTGLPQFDIDILHGGLRTGYYVLAGRTSEGKSALMVTMLENMIFQQNKSALVVSVEMSEESIGLRLAAVHTGKNASRLINGDATTYSTEERIAVSRVVEALRASRFHVVPRPMKPSQIRALASQIQRQHGLDVVFVDYLQRLHPDRAMNNRVVEVGMISGAMKVMSEELQVPVIALAQLSRAAVGREKPGLHHLRESGDIEQDADQVWLLSRTESEALFDVAKNRNGKIAEIPLVFERDQMRFKERGY